MSRARSLQYYILARLCLAPLMIWTIVTIVFLILRATPGDPADALLGIKASPEAKEQFRQQCGLGGTWWQQYVEYIGKLLHLNLGQSCINKGESVVSIVQGYFPATVELALFGLAIAFLVGLLVGAMSAAKPNSWRDLLGRLFGILTYAVPAFWAGMLAILVFAVQLGWFPVGTRYPVTMATPTMITGLYTVDSLLTGNVQQFLTALYYLILPSATLGICISGVFERIVRVNLRQTLQSDYVEAARARGIPEGRILFVHALKNALIPVVTILGLTLASLLGGALLTEITFSWPGLGQQLYEAISQRDYPTVQGIMAFFAAIVVVASLVIDILNAYIDPRIRY